MKEFLKDPIIIFLLVIIAILISVFSCEVLYCETITLNKNDWFCSKNHTQVNHIMIGGKVPSTSNQIICDEYKRK